MLRMKNIALSLSLVALAPVIAAAQPRYEVKITNLTKNSLLTPVLVATHQAGVKAFEAGSEASEALEMLAEIGDPSALVEVLQPFDHTMTAAVPAGATVTARVRTFGRANLLTVAAMILPTNDGFIAVNGRPGPAEFFEQLVYDSPGYDAGTEANDELCPNIPGPQCNGSGEVSALSPQDEGYVHIHSGIQGGGDLEPKTSDWRNPVARITVQRVWP